MQKNNLVLNFNALISAKDDLTSDDATSALDLSHLNQTMETKNLKKDMLEIKNEFKQLGVGNDRVSVID